MRAEELRKSILQQAIQGKLVKQDPNDEPASVLLERIKAEKDKLVKEGKIKKDKEESYIYKGDDNRYYEKIGKNAPVDITDDLPFDIPSNWSWVRFPNLVNFKLGKTPERKNKDYWAENTFPWASIADLVDYGEICKTKESISNSALVSCFNNELCPIGTLLMSFKLTIGKTSITKIACVHNEGIISVTPIMDKDEITKKFLFNFLRIIVTYVPQTDAIKGSTLNSGKLEKMFVPLPPLAEQERIVKRIEELMPLVDEYARLEAKDKELDEKLPAMLKQSILQYAMEGKLVKQDPNDEPASMLLERIKAEKEQLIKEGKIKRDKNETVIIQDDDKNYYENNHKIDDDFLLKFPTNTIFKRFKNVFDVRDGTHDSPKYYANGYPFISSKNLKNGVIDYHDIKFISKEDFEKYNKRSDAEENDILFGMIGTIGNPAIITAPPFKFSFKNMALIKIYKNTFNVKFIFYYLLWLEDKFNIESTGGIQKFVSLDYIRNSIVPIYSYNYQKKIVEYIDLIFCLFNFN